MALNVQQRAESLGTFRWIAVRLMRLLAEWVPTTPEMEVKVLFGRHVWDFARHADAFGRRAFELRAPMHYTLVPAAPFVEWLREIATAETAADRVAAIYDAALPAIAERYSGYLRSTDRLMDEPSARILESALADLDRMGLERGRLLDAVVLEPPRFDPQAARLRESALGSITQHGGENARARGVKV